jgi:hypothetical protein
LNTTRLRRLDCVAAIYLRVRLYDAAPARGAQAEERA